MPKHSPPRFCGAPLKIRRALPLFHPKKRPTPAQNGGPSQKVDRQSQLKGADGGIRDDVARQLGRRPAGGVGPERGRGLGVVGARQREPHGEVLPPDARRVARVCSDGAVRSTVCKQSDARKRRHLTLQLLRVEAAGAVVDVRRRQLGHITQLEVN